MFAELAHRPCSTGESADEGRSREIAQRGGKFQRSKEESASEPQRRAPGQSGRKFDLVIAD